MDNINWFCLQDSFKFQIFWVPQAFTSPAGGSIILSRSSSNF